MITVLLGLGGALVYGAADFLGGLASRRLRPVRVAAVAAVVGLVPLLVGFAVLGGRFSEQAAVAGVVAGLSGAVGVLLLYAALAIGPMSVLSPLTAVFSAVVPVVVALLRGTVLSPLGVVALVVAVVAVVLVASVPDPGGARLTLRGVVTAAVAGCGFGGVVLGYDASPPDSGVATLLVARTLQVVLLGTAALVTLRLGARLRPRPGGTSPAPATTDVRPVAGRVQPGRVQPGRVLVLVVVGCGVFDAMANVFIQAGLHSSDDPSTLPVISVLNALYPIGTVLLAGVVLRERLTALQTTGIVLAFAASVGLAVS
ncbi:EamA family transporter [Curtobacterium herbarum]|uniref:EamA family transporter n=1 Tax=Curtobacterium herbarum TaxID=150122 RepID=A0ABP4JZN3_9MICO|nr:EamA family transporter [Curtobacterium herbarum]MBM7476424.1 drug/metabolite transporter (DMT)-like permease [Curtobacterium herbarum]MCS6544011.1 EamA family transporter [Curtobacterium herbarum]